MRRLGAVGVLALVWVALWGEVSVGNVVAGLLVGLVVTWVVPVDHPEGSTVRPLHAAHYLAVFAWMLVASTWSVVVEVLRPRPALHLAVIAAPLRTRSPVVATLVANSVTLTPGTLTLEVRGDPFTLYVHALTADAESVRADVDRLERLAAAAFGPREAWWTT